MSDHGYICVSRGVLGHEFFRRKEFSELEAWLWLLCEAAWKPRSRRLGEFMVSLERGELAASTRHLMRTWSWSQGKVERFFARLKTESMVNTRTDTGVTIITICNYDRYQSGGPSADTPANTGAGQEQIRGRVSDGYNTETIKHSNNKTLGGASAPDAEKPSRAKPRRTLPDIFPVTDKIREFAEAKGYKFEIPPCFAYNKARPGPAQAMFERFKDHHRAAGNKYSDWEAAWRMWVNKQVDIDTKRGKPPGLRPAI